MVKNIRHTGIVVQDLDRSKHFWCELLGFTVEREMDEAGDHLDLMMGLKQVRVRTLKLLAPDGGRVELLHFTSHTGDPLWNGTPHSTGLTHLALTVESIESTLEKFTSAGFPQRNPVQSSPDGKVKVVYAQGPEGLLLELVEERPTP